jgi:choline dehydrogenase-like flavoprotein
VTAAKALVNAGHKVTLLDTGMTLEKNRDAARERMAATLPTQWQKDDVALTRFTANGERGPNYKQLFGSDIAFRDDAVLDFTVSAQVGARPSYALGGLSNVWGAGLLPYGERDLTGWPIRLTDLDLGYRAALEFLPYAGEQDELSQCYPLLRKPDGPLLRTRAGEEILTRLRRRSERLALAGYTFGASRLAVRVGHPAPWNGCVYCRHCLDGCPYGHIYTSAQTVEEMQRDGEIDYRPGVHVDRVAEGEDSVTLEVTATRDGVRQSFKADRVFLAAGVVSSTVILQRSGLLGPRAEILDSQALYLPFMWLGRVGRTGREPGHALAQIMGVLDDAKVSEMPIHFSLYTYSDGMSERARKTHPRLSALAGPALEEGIRRLVVAICFLHSDDSDRVACTSDPGGNAVRLESVANPRRGPTVRRFLRSLRSSLGRVGLVPVTPLAEVAPAGGGYHYGGSVPMCDSPGFGESDALGRPSGAGRVHVVDASCFPSVPAGAITFSAMANAHRIATAACALDEPR